MEIYVKGGWLEIYHRIRYNYFHERMTGEMREIVIPGCRVPDRNKPWRNMVLPEQADISEQELPEMTEHSYAEVIKQRGAAAMGRILDAKHYLLKIVLDRERIPGYTRYPFSIAAVKGLDELVLHPAVTFLIGENGAGKSTLVEAVAVAYGFNPEGGSINFNFSTCATHSELHTYMKLQKGLKKPSDGYFLRAESFYNVASSIDEMDALPAVAPKLNASYGGKSLHQMSHGESFMALMLNRFRGRGLYILDEPEAAMSPSRLLMMLSRMHELVKSGSQFIISTHSPILMAYPESKIFMIDEKGVRETAYEETEHYIVTRQFLNNRQAMLKELLT